jgi:hypothetical protein
VFTVESERQINETKGPKGELTSLASLRALLRREPAAPSTPPVQGPSVADSPVADSSIPDRPDASAPPTPPAP